MKWRCTWCGKPHAENDPPCDACGHNAFEKAVVREGEDVTGEEAASRTVDTGTTYVWACPSCGREHVRNNPPCSRCGNPDLEKTEQTYDDVDRDLATPGWFEVAKPYAPLFVVVGLVVLLFATGIVPLSLLPGFGTPTPPDAPGNETEAAGLDLETTEREIHERLADERDAAGDPARSYDDGLAAYAEYRNRQLVIAEYSDDDPGDPPRASEFDPACGESTPAIGPLTVDGLTLENYDDEADLAANLAAELLSSRFGDGVRSGYDAEGIDVHVAPDDRVYLLYAVC
ncbi:hypothetical protein [Halosolutus halophilus]|uniref:hypothetical protein n=1 Tax=Halosolutus halophilus TaxID=1552990 RepID=UPI002235070E|nr:hypothetical protein [Halosolutus halophilus]